MIVQSVDMTVSHYHMHTTLSDNVRKGLTALSSGDEDDVETAPEKRLRLAKEYLFQLQEEGELCVMEKLGCGGLYYGKES